jgi:hypothetical protein
VCGAPFPSPSPLTTAAVAPWHSSYSHSYTAHCPKPRTDNHLAALLGTAHCHCHCCAHLATGPGLGWCRPSAGWTRRGSVGGGVRSRARTGNPTRTRATMDWRPGRRRPRRGAGILMAGILMAGILMAGILMAVGVAAAAAGGAGAGAATIRTATATAEAKAYWERSERGRRATDAHAPKVTKGLEEEVEEAEEEARRSEDCWRQLLAAAAGGWWVGAQAPSVPECLAASGPPRGARRRRRVVHVHAALTQQ